MLCLFVKMSPLNIFDLMTNLVIHLIDELHICGPVHARWMYPIEQVKDLKGHV